MCGLVGVAGSLQFKEEKIFQQLLLVDSIRGEDSTGVAFVNRNGNSEVVKVVGDPFNIFSHRRFVENRKVQNKVIIGHNRAATVGKPNRMNAHPFEFDTLIGAHNGTLTNKWSMPNGNKFETDSEALFHNIEKFGVEEAISKTEGAYSLVWYDKVKDSINFLRNKERPMNLAISEDKTILLWASESWMINVFAAREQLKINNIEELPIDTLYSFKIPNVGEVFDKAKIRKVAQQEKKSHLSLPWNYYRGGHGKTIENNIKHFPAAKTKLTDDPIIGEILTFTPLTWGKDKYGAYYVSMMSNKYPANTFRIFVKTLEDAKDIKGRYSGLVDSKCEGYFKIRQSTFKSENKAITNALVLPNLTHKKDNKGNTLTEEGFNSKKTWGACCFCTQSIPFESDFRIIGDNENLCEDCANDHQVHELVNFKGV